MFSGESAEALRDHSEEKTNKRRDATRYLHAAIEDTTLSGDIADNESLSVCSDATAWIARVWLNNRTESEILSIELQNLT